MLKRAERILAVLLEDLRDTLAQGELHHVVGVQKHHM
jgi:hypothetical protein